MLGQGVYQLSEVARYAGLPQATVRAWFKGRADQQSRGALFESDYPEITGDFAVSFLNLIDVYVARFFRSQGVKPSGIRRTYETLQRELGGNHPFARQDLLTGGITIIRRTSEQGRVPELVDMLSRNHVFGQWQDHLGKIDYAATLASRLRVASGIVIDPRVSFGKPVVMATGITTFALASQYRANKRDPGLVADLFGVSEQQVLDAVEFEMPRRRSRLAA